jgi:hypothetical protein
MIYLYPSFLMGKVTNVGSSKLKSSMNEKISFTFDLQLG